MRKFLTLTIVAGLSLAAVISFAQDEEPFTLTVMHTNDTHSFHEPNGDGDGGAPRQATVVEQIRSEVENSILLDGGDRFTGTLFHVQYLGQDSAAIMNAIGYDAMTLGNHEFDNGDDILSEFIDAVEADVVTANVDFSESPVLADRVEPYVVYDIADTQVAVVGLVVPETAILSSPGDELVFEYDLISVAQSAVDELTEQGVNKIILLTHIGLTADMEIARNVTGIDLIVGGHSHTLLSNTYASAFDQYPVAVQNPDEQDVLVVQAGSQTQYLGRLDLEFDADGVITDYEGDTIFLSRYIAEDEEVAEILAELAGPIETLRAEVIGQSDVFLTGDRTVCRVEECNLGNLITDALRADTGAQIAITNGGGIRADIDEGNVTYGEVLTVLPFGNLVSTLELTGADVIAALENGVSQVTLTEDGLIQRDGASGRFPQVSGINYTFDPTQEPGSRIVEVTLEDGTALDPEATYTIATNDFMRNGGDEYTVLDENAIDPYDFGKPLDQVLIEYIQENGPVAPATEGRITSTVDVVGME